jgi:hypothetical protein
MPLVLFSQGLAAVLIAAIGLVPLAPVEHVHAMTDADGHREGLAHRHAHPHVELREPSDHDRPTVEDADTVLATLNFLSTPPIGSFVPTVATLVVRCCLTEPVEAGHGIPFDFVERVIHGPPRAPTSPRAPPYSASL